MAEIIVPVVGCFMIFGIVAAIVWGGVQTRREHAQTMRKVLESGQQLDPRTIETLMRKPTRSPEQDIRGGYVLLFLALGFLVAGLMASGVIPGVTGFDEDAGTGFYIAGAIVGFIGVGQLFAGYMRRDREGK